MAAALATIGGLVTAQEFFLSYQDIVAARLIDEAPENPELKATRAAEASALASGRMPIADAKKALAERGRAAFGEIAPQASEDYSALSGWVHMPGFKPFVPPAPPPAVEQPAAPEGEAAAAPVAAPAAAGGAH